MTICHGVRVYWEGQAAPRARQFQCHSGFYFRFLISGLELSEWRTIANDDRPWIASP